MLVLLAGRVHSQECSLKFFKAAREWLQCLGNLLLDGADRLHSGFYPSGSVFVSLIIWREGVYHEDRGEDWGEAAAQSEPLQLTGSSGSVLTQVHRSIISTC